MPLVAEPTTTTAPALARVRAELAAYQRRYTLSLLVRGGLLTAALLLSLLVAFDALEYFLYLPPAGRAVLLFGFLGVAALAVGRWLWGPLAALARLRRLLTDEQAARQVGALFPQVQDRLLNALQLEGQARDNELLQASLQQRAAELGEVRFSQAVDLQQTSRPLWKYVLPPLALLLLALAVYPSFITQPTARILNYRRHYSRPAPFAFQVQNPNLTVFRGEDFTLDVQVTGAALPNALQLVLAGTDAEAGRPLTPVPGRPGRFRYVFEQPGADVVFQLSGAGFFSDEYRLRVLERPDLRDFAVRITYPAYLGRPAETVANGGNLTVPEGSTLRWLFNTAATEQVSLEFEEPAESVPARREGESFVVERAARRTQAYQVRLRNAVSLNRNPLAYQLTVLPDLAPTVSLEAFADTAGRPYLALGGRAADDYALTRLALVYRTHGTQHSALSTKTLPLPGPAGTYAYTWNLSGLRLGPGERLEYWVEATDNDGLHGPKTTRSRPLEYRRPSRRALDQQLASQARAVAAQLSGATQKSQQLERELAQAREKMQTKRELSRQDRQQLRDMLQQRQSLDQQVQQLQQQVDQLQQQQEKSPELAQKAEELRKLMQELLDPETKKLYDELQKLLEQQKPNDAALQQLLQQLENKENTLQKELDRALDMFKQLQFEQKAEQTADRLDQLAKEEQKLAEQTKQNDKNNPDNQLGKEQQAAKQQQLQQEQAQKKQEFEELKKDLADLKKQDQEMGGQNDLDEQKPEQQQTDEDLNQSEQQLSKNQNSKASQRQSSAAQRMQKMARQMREQMSDDEEKQKQQNVDDLRDILDNLLTLSFDQERLMKDVRAVDQTDPRYQQLGQQQRKLRDDTQIIQDSLLALAKREPKIQSFVTREVGEVSGRMEQAQTQLRQRDVGRASTAQQQAMTSVNNLALMLADALQQMQQELNQMRGQGPPQPGGGKPGKKKGRGSSPGPGALGKMQQQLNQQIQQLQQSGKTGRALSQELAKLAAQQQMLRQAMQGLDNQQLGANGQPKTGPNGKPGGQQPGPGQDPAKQGGKEGGLGQAGELKKLMEQTETDLVNKRLTEETIRRQREILTRLLEAEKSARERDQDNKREAQAPRTVPPGFPPAFDQYRAPAQPTPQTEQLRRAQPALTPYYQQKVREYFQQRGQSR